MSGAWGRARRVLAVRLDAIGDVLMTTPALRALKQLPGRPHVTLLTSQAGASIAPLIPEVDDVIAHAVPWMKATSKPDRDADVALVRRLEDGAFDAAVIFTVYSQSPWPAALVCQLAGIPLRLAYGRENPYHLLSDWVPECEPERTVRHEVIRQLELVESVGAHTDDHRLSLAVPETARRRMRARLASIGVSPDREWILVHPGASAPSRRYPIEHFEAAVRQLVARGHRVVLAGGLADRPAVRRLAHVPGTACAGPTDIEDMAALASLASVLLGNNSGPTHMAAAAGTPVVVLYALTSPQHGPWGVPSRVLFRHVPCAFCYSSICPQGHHGCLARVTPGEVVAAVDELLRSPRPPETRQCLPPEEHGLHR